MTKFIRGKAAAAIDFIAEKMILSPYEEHKRGEIVAQYKHLITNMKDDFCLWILVEDDGINDPVLKGFTLAILNKDGEGWFPQIWVDNDVLHLDRLKLFHKIVLWGEAKEIKKVFGITQRAERSLLKAWGFEAYSWNIVADLDVLHERIATALTKELTNGRRNNEGESDKPVLDSTAVDSKRSGIPSAGTGSTGGEGEVSKHEDWTSGPYNQRTTESSGLQKRVAAGTEIPERHADEGSGSVQRKDHPGPDSSVSGNDVSNSGT